jgi:hypothetical protein
MSANEGTAMRTTSARRTSMTAAASAALLTAGLFLTPAGPAAAKASPGCAAGGVKVEAGSSPSTVSVTDTATGSPVSVVVTISGTSFTLAAGGGAALTTASWCVKASTRTATGTGTTGTSPSTNKHGVLQDISYVVVYSVTTQSTWPAPQCWAPDPALVPNVTDIRYVGPPNTLFNAEAYATTDGSCGGEAQYATTLIQASDADTAGALCRSTGAVPVGGGAFVAQGWWPSAPSDAWGCVYE